MLSRPSVVCSVSAAEGRESMPPSYAKQVRPFFARYCLECHSTSVAKGDLDLETVKGIMQGGKNGPVLAPGKPDESRLVLQPEKKAKPPMPPSNAKQPSPVEISVLRAWVAAGAKDDSTTVSVTLPDIKPRVTRPAPVASLAYRPDGKLVAAGGHKEVMLIDPASGDVVGTIANLSGKVTALAFSHDGHGLALAGSNPGTGGEVRLYSLSSGLDALKPDPILAAHNDMLLDLAFSPDGRLLATAGYDRLIKVWDVPTRKELRTLKDHSDAVYGLAFSPDGRLLASAAADRAVKVWDVATGARLYTLGDSTDWVYAVAWSPNGRDLAAGGVDKSIRVWEASKASGRLVRSVFAHEGPVLRLAYAADGKTLYSLGEDRVIKAWDTAQMVERKVYAKQPEAALALAVRPDHKQLALGRYDGSVLLFDEATGSVQSQPLPVKPKPPQLSKLSPSEGQRGQMVRLTLEGKYLDSVTELTSNYAGLVTKFVSEKGSPRLVAVDITFPANTPAAAYKLGLKGPLGETATLPFIVDPFRPVTKVESSDFRRTGQKVTLPVTVVGAISQAGGVDLYRFEAQAGQEIAVQALTSAVASKLEPVLQLLDLSGRTLAESSNGVLGYSCEAAGTYALRIHDRDYRGGKDMHYRLHIGDLPVISAVFPLGIQRGTEAEIHVEGVHLGGIKSVRLKAPPTAAPGSRLPIPITTSKGTPLGEASVVVGEFPEVASPLSSAAPSAQVRAVTVPGTANGRIGHPGAVQTWRFAAKKGQRLIVEVNARRLGSPLDSSIEILDAKGQPVPRATLRCVAKTYVTFRDHDSVGGGIRIETWNDFAINDYVWVGSELLRIRALPKNPDDDCQFFSAAGQRIGYLDTTPTHLSMGVPMYKVTIHPPGTTFPPNGFPVIHLDYRNDDGGPGYAKDSRLFFDPPADGDDYQVRIGDARGQGGRDHAYRLTVRPPQPSFTVSFNPTVPAVWKGGAVPITVSANRADGFEGPIDIRLKNVPSGFSAPPTSIPAGENSTAFALWADPTATVTPKIPPLKLIARASINGRDVIREVTGGVPKILEPGDLVTTTEQAEVTVQPGRQVQVTAKIERRNGFAGRVPLDVRGLPHGVRVLDIGLNGILITEKETRRTFVIYAEPWVQPTTHPIVVLARSERKGTEHAAQSVLLKVVAPEE
jgi:WD40 repeat protein